MFGARVGSVMGMFVGLPWFFRGMLSFLRDVLSVCHVFCVGKVLVL